MASRTSKASHGELPARLTAQKSNQVRRRGVITCVGREIGHKTGASQVEPTTMIPRLCNNKYFHHMSTLPTALAREIFQAAKPVICIHAVGGPRWKRNVASGGRIGPWLPARYDILDQAAWEARSPCLYLVAGDDDVIRYVGISRNRLKDRWRVSPAHDAETMVRLPVNQLFHSQCWKHIEQEYSMRPSARYEVRCITGAALVPVLARLGPPLSGFVALGNDYEGIAAGVERWLCNNKSASLVSWNVAMTAA